MANKYCAAVMQHELAAQSGAIFLLQNHKARQISVLFCGDGDEFAMILGTFVAKYHCDNCNMSYDREQVVSTVSAWNAREVVTAAEDEEDFVPYVQFLDFKTNSQSEVVKTRYQLGK